MENEREEVMAGDEEMTETPENGKRPKAAGKAERPEMAGKAERPKTARRVFHRMLGGLIGFCLMIVCLITAVDIVSYHLPGYFERTYEKFAIPEEAQISMEDLLSVTDRMMAYLRGRRETLADIRATVRGKEGPFFNEREIAHMEDVRELFLDGMVLRRFLLFVMILSLALFFLTKGEGRKILPRMLLAGAGVFFLLSCGLFLLIRSDFEQYFILFHEIFFDNDLWLLDPRTDNLINIVPLPFFIETAKTISLIYLSMIGAILGISAVVLWREKKSGR